MASGQARAVVDAGPGGFRDAVAGERHAFLQIPGIGELDLADARGGRREQDRRGTVKAVTMRPFGAPGRGAEIADGRSVGRGFGAGGERGDALTCQGVVVDADLVDVAAAQIAVGALHLVRTDDAAVRSELIEAGVEDGRLVLRCDRLAVDIEADALRLIPGERDGDPSVRRRDGIEPRRHADTRKVGVGDEGVEAVAVPVDPEPGHVPACVIGVADAEDRKLGAAQRCAGAPQKGERAALGVDVRGGVPAQHLVVRRLDIGAVRAAGQNADVIGEIGRRVAARDIGRQALVARDVEKKSGIAGRRRRGRGQDDQTGEYGGLGETFEHRGATPVLTLRPSPPSKKWAPGDPGAQHGGD